MDKKTIIAASATFITTAILALVFATIGGAFDDEIEQHERGGQALTEEQIKNVLKEVLVVDINGVTFTYGQALSRIDSRLTSMESAINILTE